MPNRILKESICTSDQISQLSWFEEAFFYRLIVNADDYGRFDGRVPIIRSRLFPLKDVRDKQIEDALAALSSVELVEVYVVDGKPFVRLTGWDKHQTIRAKKSKYPAPEEGCKQLQTIANNCKQMQADVHVIQSESESNPNPNARDTCAKRTRFSPPSPADVDAYAKEQGINVNGQRFCDFYAAKGWKVGNTGMKDWKAAARNWASRDNIPRGSPPVKAVEQQQYTQRTYAHTEDAMDRMMAEYLGGAG